jgi:DNA adenine methylase
VVKIKAPFPWFGGKSRAAHLVWEAFGDVPNYVEPFAGSLAVLLGKPTPPRIETVNDLDCYLSNFWRAMQAAPEEIAAHADWPVNEADLHARHGWLVEQTDFRARMRSDPTFYDAKLAGWWVWGISQWIGSGWCEHPEWEGRGHAASSGRGIHARTWQQKPDLSGSRGAAGRGVHSSGRPDVTGWFGALAERLRYVRVCCGDWKRVVTPSVTTQLGLTGVFLDPPYEHEGREVVYTHDGQDVAAQVREWALANGSNPGLRIVLCGYEGDYQMPKEWRCVSWKAAGGYSAARGDGANALRERLWLSPHCVKATQQDLFSAGAP